MKRARVSILSDKTDSWIQPFCRSLAAQLIDRGFVVDIYKDWKDLEKGDMLFILGCEKILPKDVLSLHKNNLVVHESDLPRGKGWSPLSWQIIEGINLIPITIFEASSKVDSGVIYYQDFICLEGHELIEEIRNLQGQYTINLCLRFADEYPNVVGSPQTGQETFYARRRPSDSEINPQQTIDAIFNQLRIADNEKYPAFFYKNGVKYIIKIYKESV